jgi:hypothetical protein
VRGLIQLNPRTQINSKANELFEQFALLFLFPLALQRSRATRSARSSHFAADERKKTTRVRFARNRYHHEREQCATPKGEDEKQFG